MTIFYSDIVPREDLRRRPVSFGLEIHRPFREVHDEPRRYSAMCLYLYLFFVVNNFCKLNQVNPFSGKNEM